MHGLETELDQARNGSTPSRQESMRGHRATPKGNGEPGSKPHNFSPDPMHDTDRYRLVTPYRLPREED